MDSWDTSNAFTLYGLVGLSRHADHHAWASRPFQDLRHWDESPKLPRGYPGMIRLVLGQNAKFQRQMTAELERRGLGWRAVRNGLVDVRWVDAEAGSEPAQDLAAPR